MLSLEYPQIMAKKPRRKRNKGRALPYNFHSLEDWLAYLADEKLKDPDTDPEATRDYLEGMALIEVLKTRPATPQEHRRLLEIFRDLAEKARGSEGITLIGEITVPDLKDGL